MKKCMIFLAGFILLFTGCFSENFKKHTVKFSAAPAAGGTVTAKIKDGKAIKNGEDVIENALLEFTAMPKDGYKVEKWEGVTANPKDSTKATLKVTQKADVKVFFVKNSTEPSEPPASEKYTVTYSRTPTEGGSLTAKIKGGADFTSGSKVPANTVLEFTAIPNDGYRVKEWTGATADTTDNTKATLTVKDNAEVKVVFEAVYTVNFSAEPKEGGKLTAKIKGGEDFTSGSKVPANTMLEFTATPKDGYRVKEWKGATADATDNTKATLKVTSNAEVKVLFEAIPKYKVDFTADGNGTIKAKKITDGAEITAGTEVHEGTKIEFTATPKDGFKVEKWEGDGLTVSAGKKTATLTVQKNVTVKVTFTVAEKHTITFSAEPAAGGAITAKRKDNGVSVTNGSQVDEETEIVFTATPAAATGSSNGYYILKWSGEGLKVSSDKKSAELTVKKDTEVKVQFQQYLIENPNWEAFGQLETKDGTSQKFYLVISDGNTLTVFDSSLGLSNSKFGRMSYDPNTKTLSFLPNQGGSGSIKFTSISPSPLPADWEIQLENVKVGTLELQNQTATINVTFNKDNFIH